jgi:hypothetical protein
MSDFFSNSLATQSVKRTNRLQVVSDRAAQQPQSIVATPTNFRTDTGSYIATTADGGEVQYKRGNFRNQPNLISVVTAKNSGIGFGDWQ